MAIRKINSRSIQDGQIATADADDNFGFNETTSFFEDAKNFDEVSGTDKEDA